MLKSFIRNRLPDKLKKILDFKNLYEQMTYTKDGLYTVHNCSFINEKDFKRSYLEGKKTGSWGNFDVEWRMHTIFWAVKKASGLDGDFVECGVNRGGFSKAIVDYLGFEDSDKKFYLLDTFEGFDQNLLLESEKKKYRTDTRYLDSFEEVKNTFKDYSNVIIIKGSVPYTLPRVPANKISFLSIDMNCVQPEAAALDFFWPKMVNGGVIVLDDFAYSGFEEQNLAHTEWAREMGIDILTIPTGQGLIIK